MIAQVGRRFSMQRTRPDPDPLRYNMNEKSKQKYLKFSESVILNSFQDLTSWAEPDAESGSA
jgi:hypothetical protein